MNLSRMETEIHEIIVCWGDDWLETESWNKDLRMVPPSRCCQIHGLRGEYGWLEMILCVAYPT